MRKLDIFIKIITLTQGWTVTVCCGQGPEHISYHKATLAFFTPLSTSEIAACLTAIVWLDRFLVAVGAIVMCL